MKTKGRIMKKLLSIILCMVVIFAFTSCNSNSNGNSNVDTVAGIEYYHYNTTDFNDKCDRLKELIDGKDATSDSADNVADSSADNVADSSADNVAGSSADNVADSSAGDSDKILKLYDTLYGECEEIDTLYAVAYVQYSTDVTNKKYSKEQQYAYNILVKSCDRLCEICREITVGYARSTSFGFDLEPPALMSLS